MSQNDFDDIEKLTAREKVNGKDLPISQEIDQSEDNVEKEFKVNSKRKLGDKLSFLIKLLLKFFKMRLLIFLGFRKLANALSTKNNIGGNNSQNNYEQSRELGQEQESYLQQASKLGIDLAQISKAPEEIKIEKIEIKLVETEVLKEKNIIQEAKEVSKNYERNHQGIETSRANVILHQTHKEVTAHIHETKALEEMGEKSNNRDSISIARGNAIALAENLAQNACMDNFRDNLDNEQTLLNVLKESQQNNLSNALKQLQDHKNNTLDDSSPANHDSRHTHERHQKTDHESNGHGHNGH
ncbi:MAG: hypothetical protein J0H68_01005 [Sphingobacteriia bacterium]|nr:hypothetical protein [Sphingobacteriia bacterium]